MDAAIFHSASRYAILYRLEDAKKGPGPI